MGRPSFADSPENIGFGPPPNGPEPWWLKNNFADDVWQLNFVDGAQHDIDFTRISSPFRITCKILLWALTYEGDTRFVPRRARSASTPQRYYYEFRALTDFLAAEKVFRLASVDEIMLGNYISNRTNRTSTLSKVAYVRLAALFAKLYRLGPAGSGLLPDGLIVEFSMNDVRRYIPVERGEGETPIIPDEIARALALSAIEFLEHAPAICLLQKLVRQFQASPCHAVQTNGRQGSRNRLRFLKATGQLEQALEACRSLRVFESKVLPPIYDLARYSPIERELIFLSPTRVYRLVQHLSCACFTTIAVMTGFRAQEILSIKQGSIKKSGLGSIVTTLISKNMDSIGGVFVDRPCNKLLLEVDEVLQNLADANGRNDYWALGIGQMAVSRLSPFINDFAKEIGNIDSWWFTSRQFRRFFAIFFVRRFQGPDDALRRAFRHACSDSLKSYVRDLDCAKHLVEVKTSVAIEIYKGLAFDGTYSSLGIVPVTKEIQHYAASNVPMEEIEKRLNQTDLDVWPTAWGYCLLHKNDPYGAICGGTSGVPRPLEMHPANCGRCRHLAVGLENRGFWMHTKNMHEEIVGNPTTTAAARKASMAMTRMAEAIIESGKEERRR